MYFSYLVVTGLTTGSLYALVALGLVVVYRATKVVNFAHGEIFMVTGFVAWTTHVTLGLPYLVALAVAAAVGFGLGLLLYMVSFRPLAHLRDLNPILMVMIGVAFVLKGLARDIWGGKGDYLTFPPLVSPVPIEIAGIMVMSQQLVVLGASLVAMGCLFAFFRLTRAGKFMQATADNPKAARLVGLQIDRIHMYTFGVGAAIAGVSATLMAPLTLLYPDIGFLLFIKGFAAAILGGLASVPGAIVGGLLLGLAEQLAAGYIHTSLQEVAAFIVIMLVLIFIPSGLFGTNAGRDV